MEHIYIEFQHMAARKLMQFPSHFISQIHQFYALLLVFSTPVYNTIQRGKTV